MITEAEESHNLLSASWNPRRPNGVAPRPESQTPDGGNPCLSQKEESSRSTGLYR